MPLISDKYISLPHVTVNNKGEHVKAVIKVNAAMIVSYFEAQHLHESGEETTIIYLYVGGRNDVFGIPLSIEEFEKQLEPYLPLIEELTKEEDRCSLVKIPIRYKDFQQSELMGNDIFIDTILNVNPRYIFFYHEMPKKYNEEEVECLYFSVGANSFYTLLSEKEFIEIISIKNK